MGVTYQRNTKIINRKLVIQQALASEAPELKLEVRQYDRILAQWAKNMNN